MSERIIKHVKTDEDWYPTYPDGTVCVFHCELPAWGDRPRMWRTAVSGADDCGMELDTTDQAKALELYERICDGITKRDLKDLGFVPA